MDDADFEAALAAAFQTPAEGVQRREMTETILQRVSSNHWARTGVLAGAGLIGVAIAGSALAITQLAQPIGAWAMKIAARLYLKRRRREARTELMAEPVGIDVGGPSEEMGSIARMDLDRALQRLSAPERLCVSLCHGAGLKHDEIALALRVPLGTVKSHVTRGLKKLRALMTEPGSDPNG